MEPSQYRTGSRRYVAAGVAIFLLFALLANAVVAMFGSSILESRLRAWIHPQLQINGTSDIQLLPGLKVEINDLLIPQADSGYPLATIDRLRLEIDWWEYLADDALNLDVIRIEGLKVYLLEPAWGYLRQEINAANKSWFPWLQRSRGSTEETAVQRLLSSISIGTLELMDGSVLAFDASGRTKALLQVGQVSGSLRAEFVPELMGRCDLNAQRLEVNASDESTHLNALLEQIGMSAQASFIIERFESQWSLAPDRASLVSARVTGPWGEMKANEGSITFDDARMLIPVQAHLTGGIQLQMPALSIRTRESHLQFDLTGTLLNPGVVWQQGAR
jgi:uncharacterized protein involved in outer membrane biogenesis